MLRSATRKTLVLLLPLLLVAACSDDDPASPGDNDNPDPVTLCAADRGGDVYTVDETSGEETLLVDTWLEVRSSLPEDLGVVSSMLYVPQTGEWWLGSGGEGTCDGCIMTLDPDTGEATVLSSDGGSVHGLGVSGLAIHPDNGRIFTFCSDCGSDMFEIDPVTGAWTQIDDAVGTGGRGNGTTFSSGGLLYVVSDEELFQVDYEDGSVVELSALSYTGFPAFQGNHQPIVSMTTRPGDGAVFGILLDGGGNGSPGASYLVRVNLQTAEITNIGVNTNQLIGLAFIPTAILD